MTDLLLKIAAGWTTFAYVFKGGVSVDEDPTRLESYNTLVFSSEEGQSGVSITALDDETEFILVRTSPSVSPNSFAQIVYYARLLENLSTKPSSNMDRSL